MTILLLVALLLIASAIVCLALVRPRTWIKIICVLGGILGVVTVVVIQRGLQRELTAVRGTVREQCHSTANALRAQARRIRDPEMGAAAKQDLSQWHALDGAALALWTLCVRASCDPPGGYAPQPDVMDRLAEMLDTGACAPEPTGDRTPTPGHQP